MIPDDVWAKKKVYNLTQYKIYTWRKAGLYLGHSTDVNIDSTSCIFVSFRSDT